MSAVGETNSASRMWVGCYVRAELGLGLSRIFEDWGLGKDLVSGAWRIQCAFS